MVQNVSTHPHQCLNIDTRKRTMLHAYTKVLATPYGTQIPGALLSYWPSLPFDLAYRYAARSQLATSCCIIVGVIFRSGRCYASLTCIEITILPHLVSSRSLDNLPPSWRPPQCCFSLKMSALSFLPHYPFSPPIMIFDPVGSVDLLDSIPIPPLTIFAIQILTISSVTGFTSPHSIVRLAALAQVGICTCAIVLTSRKYMRAHWASLFAGTSVGFLLQYVELALLSKWSLETHGSVSQSANVNEKGKHTRPEHSTRMQRCRFGISSTFSFRNVNSSNEVKNVPFFSDRPGYLPSRSAFLARATIVLLACFLMLDLLAVQPASSNTAQVFSWELVPLFTRLNSVTNEELILRLVASNVYWISMYCIMQGVTAAASIVAVGLGISEINQWRPLFDSPFKAYTLRRFWG